MSVFPLPANEHERLVQLGRYDLIGSASELRYDAVVKRLAAAFSAPISLISIVGAGEQWFKARYGTDIVSTPRNQSFCTHALLTDELLVIPDTDLDVRFATNPLVLRAPNIRFYAGAPLISADGYGLGALCVIDNKPRHDISADQLNILVNLRRLVMTMFDQMQKI